MTLTIDQEIRLELTSERHAEGLFEALVHNREHLSKFLSWVDHMQSVDDFHSYIKNCESLYEQGMEVSFVILANEVVVGRIGLHHINDQNKCAAIGYWLTKDAEGKGIITKSCKELLNYGFRDLRLQRIEIKVAVENVRSQAIPETLHFVKEGILRQAELVNNKFLDLVLYSMIRKEWSEEIPD